MSSTHLQHDTTTGDKPIEEDNEDNDNRIPYIFRDHECCNQNQTFFMAIKEVKSNPFLMFTLKRGLEMTVCNVLDILKQLSHLKKPSFAHTPYKQKTLNPKPRS